MEVSNESLVEILLKIKQASSSPLQKTLSF